MKQNRLETTVAVRITPQDRKVWEALAAARGARLSDVLREALTADVALTVSEKMKHAEAVLKRAEVITKRANLVHLALSLTATSGTIAELVKKYEFHGHALDRERLRRLVVQVLVTCEQITEAIDDGTD